MIHRTPDIREWSARAGDGSVAQRHLSVQSAEEDTRHCSCRCQGPGVTPGADSALWRCYSPDTGGDLHGQYRHHQFIIQPPHDLLSLACVRQPHGRSKESVCHCVTSTDSAEWSVNTRRGQVSIKAGGPVSRPQSRHGHPRPQHLAAP